MGWCLQGGLDDNPASHAVADQHGRRQRKGLHDFRDIGPVPLDGAIGGHARACAVPAQINGDRKVTC